MELEYLNTNLCWITNIYSSSQDPTEVLLLSLILAKPCLTRSCVNKHLKQRLKGRPCQNYRHQNPQLNQMSCIERLKRNFYSLGYYCTPNLSIHQNSTQKLTWNFLVTLVETVLRPGFYGLSCSKVAGFEGGFDAKTFQELHFCFLGHLVGRYIFELFRL